MQEEGILETRVLAFLGRGGSSQREGINLAVFVPVWLAIEGANLGVSDLCHFDLLNGTVQGLELADIMSYIQQFPRVTSTGSLPPKNLGKSSGPPQNPAETPQNPRRDPAEASERPPQSPLRVVPLTW